MHRFGIPDVSFFHTLTRVQAMVAFWQREAPFCAVFMRCVHKENKEH